MHDEVREVLRKRAEQRLANLVIPKDVEWLNVRIAPSEEAKWKPTTVVIVLLWVMITLEVVNLAVGGLTLAKLYGY